MRNSWKKNRKRNLKGKDGIKWFGEYFDNIPIPSEKVRGDIESFVRKILSMKKSNPYSYTSQIENQID